jgi:hypothetical protein
MDELQSMTVRDLIVALAEAEDASRLARRSEVVNGKNRRSQPGRLDLEALVAREDAILAELRRRSGISEHVRHDPSLVSVAPDP